MLIAGVAALLGVDALGLVLAAAGDSAAADPLIGYVLNFGVLGVVTVLWITNRIKTAGDVAKAEARAEAAENRERTLNDTIRVDVVPAMVRFTDTATRILDREHRA